MLRLVLWLAIVVLWPVAAWAQTAEAVDAAKQAVAQIQHDGVPGPIAVLAGLGAVAVIVTLFLWVRSLIAENNRLRDKRGDDADARAERFATVAEGYKSTSADMLKATDGFRDRLDTVEDTLKVQSTALDALLKGQDANTARMEKNGEGISKLLRSRA